jgi:hypothetical protein
MRGVAIEERTQKASVKPAMAMPNRVRNDPRGIKLDLFQAEPSLRAGWFVFEPR